MSDLDDQIEEVQDDIRADECLQDTTDFSDFHRERLKENRALLATLKDCK